MNARSFGTSTGIPGFIFLWAGSHLFHIGWQGGFTDWLQSPTLVRPVAHAIRDPQWGAAAIQSSVSIVSTSGLYQWYATLGLRTEADCFNAAIFTFAGSALFLLAGLYHSRSLTINTFSLDSLPVHHSHPLGLRPLFDMNWAVYGTTADTTSHVFGQADGGSGTAILTFVGARHPESGSLWLTDISHHHLAIDIIALLLGHLLGQQQQDWANSLYFQLALSLSFLGTASTLTPTYGLLAYPFMAIDYATHHMWIVVALAAIVNQDGCVCDLAL